MMGYTHFHTLSTHGLKDRKGEGAIQKVQEVTMLTVKVGVVEMKVVVITEVTAVQDSTIANNRS